jgi:hypothetical protein
MAKDRPVERDPSAIDEEIGFLVHCIREDQREIETRQASIAQTKSRLMELIQLRGSNWSDDEGYARLASEGKRTYYDTVSLDDLIITDPLRYGWLKDYRREATIAQRLQVK